MSNEALSEWNLIFGRRFSDFSNDELLKYQRKLISTTIENIPEADYKNYMKLMRHILLRGELKKHLPEEVPVNEASNKHKNDNDLQHALKGNNIDESYYIQKIQDLNHEIAHNVYNRGTGIGDADSSAHPMGIDTKKDLLSRIHTKNKYIKRLLCENDSLRQQIDTLNEKNVQLDICLKQTTNRLTKANSDLLELQRQNSISADDILILNNKIREISQQMCNMEKEKVKYQTDILFLGQEIHKRVDRWNDALRHKREKEPRVQNASVSDDEGAHLIGNDLMRENIRQDLKELEKDRMEISVLSQAVNKRNTIISELELLLTDLTMEVAHSADVINNLTKSFVIRENNFAENLDKLQGHLSALLQKQKPQTHANDKRITSLPSSPQLITDRFHSIDKKPSSPLLNEQKPKINRKTRKTKERTL